MYTYTHIYIYIESDAQATILPSSLYRRRRRRNVPQEGP
jgi:hypothetical protein